jgi:hypothetical protein
MLIVVEGIGHRRLDQRHPALQQLEGVGEGMGVDRPPLLTKEDTDEEGVGGGLTGLQLEAEGGTSIGAEPGLLAIAGLFELVRAEAAVGVGSEGIGDLLEPLRAGAPGFV